MTRNIGRAGALALALLASGASAGDTADPATYRLVQLLDTSLDVTLRTQAFEHYRHEALAGDRFDQYVIGSLYRIGERLPGNLAPRDPDQAGRYLSTAAAHGYLTAMAKMAELELDAGRPLQAMLWAQLYGHYTLDAADPESTRQPSGYYANLLHRVYAAYDSKQEPAMQRHLAAFIALHDADIRAGIAEGAVKYESGAMHSKISHVTYDPLSARISGVRNDELADYLVGFSADGNAQQAWMLDAVPDINVGRELKIIALRVRVNPDADPALRYGLVPIQYTHGDFVVRKKQ